MIHYQWNIIVRRIGSNGKYMFEDIWSDDLVPGDIIEVPEGVKMPCDAILLSGSWIVNETMLTGESVPVIKNSLPYSDHEYYDYTRDKVYTLFWGTEVIQKRLNGSDNVLALTIKTNYDTLKGSMIKSILFPKNHRFDFYADSMRFMIVMGIMSFIGFWLTLYGNIEYFGFLYSLIKALDLVTVAVPPALPAAMSIGTVYALSRIRKGKIYCISPQHINVAGLVKTIVFDKTGTLTEDGLKFAGVITKQHDNSLDNLSLTTQSYDSEFINWCESKCLPDQASVMVKSLECMITCHWIANVNGKLIGDPIDIEMLKATHWTLDDTSSDGKLWTFYKDSHGKF